MFRAVIFQSFKQAQIEMTPLVHYLTLTITLLPAMQAVADRTFMLFGNGVLFIRFIACPQPMRKTIEHAGNMIVELAARED